jgi:hypothetical protein
MKIEQNRIQNKKEAEAKREAYELEQAKNAVEFSLSEANKEVTARQNELDYINSMLTNADEFELT